MAVLIMSDLLYYCISFLLCLFPVLFFFRFLLVKRSQNDFCLPPSPPALPFIGHLHHFLSVPFHKPLQKLSSKYGPLLYLRAFHYPMVLLSSASIAHEVYRTHDANFSSRNVPAVGESILFGSYGFITAPYGNYWKFMKKLVVTELLGQPHLERSRGVRAEEVKRFFVKLLDKARRNEVVDVGKEMMKLTNNSICSMTMGIRCSEEDGEAEKVRDLVTKSFALARKSLITSALRPLKKFGISLFEEDFMNLSRRFDEMLEKILREHEENPDREHKDMMDLLLGAYQDEKAEYKITRNHIKAFFVDMFIGGTDTSAQSTQWTMAELINHPNILRKLRDEIEAVVGQTRLVQETDLPNLPYLQAVIKEGLRLHPPGPILPRRCIEGCKVGGFDIPHSTTLMVNVHAIMRDPDSWENPDEFRPERFLKSSSKGQEGDNKAQSLKFLPFGAGRRGCPATNLAYRFMGTAIGMMVQCFDWKIDGQKVNMEEAGDMVLSMAYPLLCTPVVRFNPYKLKF